MEYEAKLPGKQYLSARLDNFIAVDKTLTKEGACAEAKATGEAIAKAKTEADTAISQHANNKSNPHGVTASQVGALSGTDPTLSVAGRAADAAAVGTALASKAPADILMSVFLTTAGWYKVGTVRPLDQYCGSLRITTDGSYYNNEPPCAVIDVIFGYSWANAKTVVASPGGNGGISKVALVKESGSACGVYVYYNVNYKNQACLKIREMGSIFTPVDFEAVANFNEASVSAMADVYSASYAPSGYGLGESDHNIPANGAITVKFNSNRHAALISVQGSTMSNRAVFAVNTYGSGGVRTHIERLSGTAEILYGILPDSDAENTNGIVLFNQTADTYVSASILVLQGDYPEVTEGSSGVIAEPFEWVNPPMQPGVEYRTTERWNGKVVYAKLVNCGTVTAEGCVSTSTSITHLVESLFSCGAINSPFHPYNDTYRFEAWTDGDYVWWVAGSAQVSEANTVYATIKYTKD